MYLHMSWTSVFPLQPVESRSIQTAGTGEQSPSSHAGIYWGCAEPFLRFPSIDSVTRMGTKVAAYKQCAACLNLHLNLLKEVELTISLGHLIRCLSDLKKGFSYIAMYMSDFLSLAVWVFSWRVTLFSLWWIPCMRVGKNVQYQLGL